MGIGYIQSSEIRPFLDDQKISGCQSFAFSFNEELIPTQNLGDFGRLPTLPLGRPESNVTLNWHFGLFSPDLYYVLTGTPLGVYNDRKKISWRDLAGENVTSGYLSSYKFSASVGEITQVETNWICDSFVTSTGNPTINQSHTNDSYRVVTPDQITLSSSSFHGSLHIQNVDFDFNIDRGAVTQVGEKFPRVRPARNPVVGNISFSAIKDDYFTLDNTGRFSGPVLLGFNIALPHNIVFEFPSTNLRGASQSCDINGRELINFDFSLNVDENFNISF